MNDQNNIEETDGLEEPLGPSKSERKREMHQIRDLAAELADLKPEKVALLELPDNLALSIEQARKLKSSNARNRQHRHSAKLMEGNQELLSRIRDYFEEQGNLARNIVQHHKQVELWRDRLMDTSQNALSDFFDEFPATDRQELSTLVRNARKEKQQEKPPAQQRKLFKYLRDQALATQT